MNQSLALAMAEPNFDSAIRVILRETGLRYNCDETILLEGKAGKEFDETYKWPETDSTKLLKNLDYETYVKAFYEIFDKKEDVYSMNIEEYEESYPELYRLLESKGIKRIVLSPIFYRGQRLGFFALINPAEETVLFLPNIVPMIGSFLALLLIQRNSQKKIFDFSYSDPLTGARNRRALFEDLAKKKEPITYFFFDINGLKQANDQYGHIYGDKLILFVVSVLMKNFGRENVYRMGGDEFLATHTKMTPEECQKLYHLLKHEVHEENASVAISYYSEENGKENFDDCFKILDSRMYIDKEKHHQSNGYKAAEEALK